VTNPVDRTHAVLLRVSEFLKALPADQIDDLVAGTAKLEVVPKGGRPAARRPAAAKAATKAATKAAPSPVTPDTVRAELAATGDTAGAERYINGLKLTVPQLRALAGELGISLSGKAVKAEVGKAATYALALLAHAQI